jgi:hypothetical protein
LSCCGNAVSSVLVTIGGGKSPKGGGTYGIGARNDSGGGRLWMERAVSKGFPMTVTVDDGGAGRHQWLGNQRDRRVP